MNSTLATPVARADGEGGAAYRARLGFPGPRSGAMGLADRELLEWYQGEHARGDRYLAEWSDAFEVRLILVRDWPTLLKLRARACEDGVEALYRSSLDGLEAHARGAPLPR